MKLIISCIICMVPFFLDAQTITTIVGNGLSGYNGDNVSAISAKLSLPADVAFDALENMYIADANNKRIRKVLSTGIILTVAGSGTSGTSGDGGPATIATLDNPSGVAVDALGNIYIADMFVNKIRVVSSGGSINTFAGTGTGGFNGDGIAATSAMINNPIDIIADKNGNIYFTESARIRKVTGGIISTVAGNGILGFSGDNGAATNAMISGPHGLALDALGNLYIADQKNYRIRKVSPTGIITTIAGNGINKYAGDDGAATAASIFPWGVAVDKFGNLFVADYLSNVRKVDNYGIISTVAGNGMTGDKGDGGLAITAQLDHVYGLALDSCGNVYVADAENQRIRKITYPKCHYLETETLPQVSSQISIYPNPSNDILHIDNLQTPADYRLLGMVGAVLQQGGLKERNNTINIAELPVGMYVVELSNAAVGLRMMYKIVKQ